MLPRVKVGEMRQRVTIEFAASVVDPYGEPIETWGPIGRSPTIPAEVIFKTGRESTNAQQTKAFASWRVRHRYRSGITVAHRFVEVDSGRVLAIVGGGDPDGRRREMAWDCTEVVDLGGNEEE